MKTVGRHLHQCPHDRSFEVLTYINWADSQLNRSASVANPRAAVAPSENITRTEHPAETAVPKPPSRRARTRGPIVSRFKGFDDDDVSVAPVPSQPGPAESDPSSVPRSKRSQRYTVSIESKASQLRLTSGERHLLRRLCHRCRLSST